MLQLFARWMPVFTAMHTSFICNCIPPFIICNYSASNPHKHVFVLQEQSSSPAKDEQPQKNSKKEASIPQVESEEEHKHAKETGGSEGAKSAKDKEKNSSEKSPGQNSAGAAGCEDASKLNTSAGSSSHDEALPQRSKRGGRGRSSGGSPIRAQAGDNSRPHTDSAVQEAR